MCLSLSITIGVSLLKYVRNLSPNLLVSEVYGISIIFNSLKTLLITAIVQLIEY